MISPATSALKENVAKALTLSTELGQALLICHRMPGAQALSDELTQVMDLLYEIVGEIERCEVQVDEAEVTVERCLDVLFDVQAVIEEFLDAENGRLWGSWE